MNHLFKKFSVLLTVTSLLFVACGDNPVEPEPEPSFSIASVSVMINGVPAINFFATPDKDVKLTRVEVTDPVGTKNELTGGDDIFFANAPIDLDNPYLRVSGSWKFRFVGAVMPSNEVFDVTESQAISAKVGIIQEAEPNEYKKLNPR